MSKVSEIAGYWVMAKKAMLIGLGYFAATNPLGTAKFLYKVVPSLVHSMGRDTYLIVKEAGKELILPEARQTAKQIVAGARGSGSALARPMIWGGFAQPTFILVGGALAQTIHMGSQEVLDLFDWEWGESGITEKGPVIYH